MSRLERREAGLRESVTGAAASVGLAVAGALLLIGGCWPHGGAW